MSYLYIFWLVLAIAFLIIEFGTVTLISLWFVGGSLAAMAAALLGAPLWLQVLIFAVVSLALLLLLRPFFRKYVNPHKVKTNVDAMIGKQAIVIEPISNLAGVGAIRLDGVIWSARSAENKVIPAGTVVTVQAIEGVKAMVRPDPAFVQTNESE